MISGISEYLFMISGSMISTYLFMISGSMFQGIACFAAACRNILMTPIAFLLSLSREDFVSHGGQQQEDGENL